MRNPGFKPAITLRVPYWHTGRSSLEGPAITVSGRQILLGTLAN
jgi:hypothetical protein